MTLKPLDDRVVIVPTSETEEKKVGGIIIPDSAKEKPQIAEVVAIGTDEDLKEILKIGDKVLYAKYGGTEIELEGKKYLIVGRNDILAIMEN